MNFNILLIKKIDNILDMSAQFDKLCTQVLDDKLSEKNPSLIYNITSLYILVRAEHGGILLLNDKMKMEITKRDTKLNDETINKLYDLSTFTSIIENIANLVSNLDFEYKKIALMFPKLIDAKQIDLVLFSKTLDKEDKYVKLIEDVKNLRNQYNYHVIECDKVNKVINCDKILKRKISINVEKLPSLFLINGDNIVELPINKINETNDLIKLID
jgi:hypothetical protein